MVNLLLGIVGFSPFVLVKTAHQLKRLGAIVRSCAGGASVSELLSGGGTGFDLALIDSAGMPERTKGASVAALLRSCRIPFLFTTSPALENVAPADITGESASAAATDVDALPFQSCRSWDCRESCSGLKNTPSHPRFHVLAADRSTANRASTKAPATKMPEKTRKVEETHLI